MGGEMTVPGTNEEFHNMLDIAESMVTQTHEKCLHATGALLIWAGITDQYEEDTWVNPYTREESGLTVWQPGRPNGGPIRNCARTYLGKYRHIIITCLLKLTSLLL